ncbi:hypothetical protein MRS44_018127 [Fusarium solani]|uniref:uncharacterized protein n=1 Tax=Fusarium solani TaxID=169388 RepID=UPI0032C48857|nr:hypothetical protein MRS44_018127 [Fusarium solani]
MHPTKVTTIATVVILFLAIPAVFPARKLFIYATQKWPHLRGNVGLTGLAAVAAFVLALETDPTRVDPSMWVVSVMLFERARRAKMLRQRIREFGKKWTKLPSQMVSTLCLLISPDDLSAQGGR